MSFQLLTVYKIVYASHDGYCSGADENEDYHREEETIEFNEVPDLPEDAISENGEVAIKHLKLNTQWQDCGGSGYCGINNTKTVIFAMIVPKDGIKKIYLENKE